MMTMAVKITLVIALILSIVIPFGAFLLGERNKGRFKTSLAVNVFFFFGIMIIATAMMLIGNPAAHAAVDTSSDSFATGMGYIGAALVTGLSCVGGGIAVASAASAALGAISEDQSVLGKALIFVGLAEGIALYGLIISFMILGQLG